MNLSTSDSKRRLWVYNYDLEFELANIAPVFKDKSGFSPWYFLNRASQLFFPLAEESDLILAYEKPSGDVIERLRYKLGYCPDYLLLSDGVSESNSVFDEGMESTYPSSIESGVTLAPWGWGPKAVQFSKTILGERVDPGIGENVRRLNSKRFSFLQREKVRDKQYAYPSQDVVYTRDSVVELESIIRSFYEAHSDFYVKHYHGTAGKLADLCFTGGFSTKKIKKWRSWMSKTGGILLEKRLTAEREWSIQVDLSSGGDILPIALTRLFSGRNGSYRGNMIKSTYGLDLRKQFISLIPIFEEMVETGFRGPVGVDLIETDSGELKLVEINCRYTMGRIAFEWNRAINRFPVGFFSNLFFRGIGIFTQEIFFDLIEKIEKRGCCSICVINLVYRKERNSLFVTLLMGAQSEDMIWGLLAVFKEEMEKVFKLQQVG